MVCNPLQISFIAPEVRPDIVTAAASMGVGTYVARSSDRSAASGALRQLLIVAAASAVTYGIGKVFGAAIT